MRHLCRNTGGLFIRIFVDYVSESEKKNCQSPKKLRVGYGGSVSEFGPICNWKCKRSLFKIQINSILELVFISKCGNFPCCNLDRGLIGIYIIIWREFSSESKEIPCLKRNRILVGIQLRQESTSNPCQNAGEYLSGSREILCWFLSWNCWNISVVEYWEDIACRNPLICIN